jgi:hypothetical protein
MHLDLFTALQSVKIEDAKARAVVDALQEHIDMQISQATQPVIAKLEAIETRMESRIEVVSGKIDSMRWFIGAVGVVVGLVVGVALKVFG